MNGGTLAVLLDDGGRLVLVEGGGAAEGLAGGLGGGDALAGVLADHVALELQHGLQDRDHHFRARVVAGQVDAGQQSGFDAQVEAAADEYGAQGEDVGDGAEQAGGVGDTDGVTDCGRMQQCGEARAVEGELPAGGGGVFVDRGACGQQGGEGVPLAGVGLLVGGVPQIDQVSHARHPLSGCW
nr:hypothetical protein [Microbispora triticiradicis]